MHKTETVRGIQGNTFFSILLHFYPQPYRQRFGDQILLVMEDMYHEKVAVSGSAGIRFWVSAIFDIVKNIMHEHGDYLRNRGMRNYLIQVLHVDGYTLLAIYFLLPFGSMFVLDGLSRIVQGDLLHPNQSVDHALYNTPFYWFPVLFSWVILFPLLAVCIALYSLYKKLIVKRNVGLYTTLLVENSVSIILISVGVFFLMVFALHDAAPCFITGLFSTGVGRIIPLIHQCMRV